MELFSNPTIIGAVIGALVGAIASAAFAIIYDWKKVSKQKNGAKALIQSEISYSIELLEHFRNEYLIDKIVMSNETKKYKELHDFYDIMGEFPVLTNRNWLKLISFIPSTFNQEDITKINTFYANCDKIMDIAKDLSIKSKYTTCKIYGEELKNYPKVLVDPESINNDRDMFRKYLNELINMGNEVNKIF